MRHLCSYVEKFDGLNVLDAGCGEGKNAMFLAGHGATVHAIDVSELAIANARAAWQATKNVTWEIADVRDVTIGNATFDIVVAYGLLHCLRDHSELEATLKKLQNFTKVGGFNVVCAFNSRFQDLSAHPGFSPCLLSHANYLSYYSAWRILESSDSDLEETHPHNLIPHTHSLTRIIARKEFAP